MFESPTWKHRKKEVKAERFELKIIESAGEDDFTKYVEGQEEWWNTYQSPKKKQKLHVKK